MQTSYVRLSFSCNLLLYASLHKDLVFILDTKCQSAVQKLSMYHLFVTLFCFHNLLPTALDVLGLPKPRWSPVPAPGSPRSVLLDAQ